MVADLARRWSLEVGRPFQPGDVASWVAPARNRADELVVLKVAWLHDEARHEADGLRAWHGQGSVRLLHAVVFDDTAALLLEACQPGTSLSRALPPLDQDEVVAGLLRRLWIQPPPRHRFRPLQDMCDWWVDEYDEKAAAQGTRLDPGLARAGVEPVPGPAGHRRQRRVALHRPAPRQRPGG